MRKTEENYLSMVKSVLSLLKTQNEVILPPIINTLITKVEEKTELAFAKNVAVTTKTKGLTLGKEDAKDDMIDKVLVLANTGIVYARLNNDQELVNICNVSESKLDQMRDSEIAPKCTDIINRLADIKDSLVDYGLTDNQFTDASAAVEAYTSSFSSKDVKVAEKVGARKDLGKILSEIKVILNSQIDPLMENYKYSNPTFFNSYTAARVVRDLGLRHQVAEEEG